MKKIKRALAVAGVTALAMVGLAAPAHAYTKSNCYWVYVNNTSYGQRALSCYYDYNWWEETFLGKRDGRFYEYQPQYV